MSIFLISDLHFDHEKMLKCCNRPFNSTEEMNTVIINNWNKTVKNEDTIYFLGDFVYGKGNKGMDFWAEKLNGNIIYIKGNHDKSETIELIENKILEYKTKKFYLVHDPKDIPYTWKDWAICGHHHNNYLNDIPLINGKIKIINVSVELLNYTPLNIDKLFKIEFEKVLYMQDINSKPVYFKE